MQPTDAIRERRSVKKFTDRPISREEIEVLLESAVLAPNHRLTNPWRFYVLGPEARYAYGLVLGGRKAKKIEDPEAAQKMRETVAGEHRSLPGMIAIAISGKETDTDEIREEDYASVMMAIQNLSLAAVQHGLGTAIRSGAIMSDPAARAAAGVRDNERIVAIVNVGVPADSAPSKPREAASSLTTWMP